MTYELANRIVTTVLMNEGLARYFHEHDIKVTYAEYKRMTADVERVLIDAEATSAAS